MNNYELEKMAKLSTRYLMPTLGSSAVGAATGYLSSSDEDKLEGTLIGAGVGAGIGYGAGVGMNRYNTMRKAYDARKADVNRRLLNRKNDSMARKNAEPGTYTMLNSQEANHARKMYQNDVNAHRAATPGTYMMLEGQEADAARKAYKTQMEGAADTLRNRTQSEIAAEQYLKSNGIDDVATNNGGMWSRFKNFFR